MQPSAALTLRALDEPLLFSTLSLPNGAILICAEKTPSFLQSFQVRAARLSANS
jgi:hypothetical protein